MRLLATVGVLALAGCAGLRQVPHADPPGSVVVRDVTLVDVDSGSLRAHTTVTVRGSLITDVANTADAKTPTDALVVDGRGRYLIPGLWDMHSHALWRPEVVRTFLPLYVANGVTGIRDMGGQLPILRSVRESQGESDPLWPRVVAAGEVLDGPEPVHREISIAVSDVASARTAVDTLARSGVDFIKVYTLLPRDAYFAVIAEARRVGLPVAGHVPADVSVFEAAQAGQASIEHLRDEIEPFCSPLDTDSCSRLAQSFRENRTWQVPTLAVLHSKAYFDEQAIATDMRLRYLPAGLREEWLAEREGKLQRGTDYVASKRKRYADASWITAFLSRERVPLLAGSDAGNAFCYPGFSLHDELQLMVATGLAPIEALRAATLAPAEFFAARGSMGTIAAGNIADMVLLRSNPLVDIGATREIESVMLRGRLLDRRQLDDLLDAIAEDARNAPEW